MVRWGRMALIAFVGLCVLEVFVGTTEHCMDNGFWAQTLNLPGDWTPQGPFSRPIQEWVK